LTRNVSRFFFINSIGATLKRWSCASDIAPVVSLSDGCLVLESIFGSGSVEALTEMTAMRRTGFRPSFSTNVFAPPEISMLSDNLTAISVHPDLLSQSTDRFQRQSGARIL
jgi:hypothetical protein